MPSWIQVLVGLLMILSGAAIIYFKVKAFRKSKDPVALKIIENLVFLEVAGGVFLLLLGLLAIGQVVKNGM